MLSTPVAIALGSNLGDRRAHLTWAFEQLGRYLTDLRISSILETEPFDVPDPQPPYLNAVAVGETAVAPAELVVVLLRLERARGRTRTRACAPRTLDLDLILHGDLILETPTLVLPHPRFRERRFVLEPLAELAPKWKDPVTGRSVEELLRSLRQS